MTYHNKQTDNINEVKEALLKDENGRYNYKDINRYNCFIVDKDRVMVEKDGSWYSSGLVILK